MKNYKIKTSFVSSEGPKARANETGLYFMIFILLSVENTKNDFSVCLEPFLIQLILIGLEAILESNGLTSHRDL